VERAVVSVERIGQRQYAVLYRARRGKQGNVMPGGFLERRACRRLTARGLMRPLVSFPDVWTLTDQGFRCPVVVQ
jgi:hypothetical protein